jgi:hypothetical protein
LSLDNRPGLRSLRRVRVASMSHAVFALAMMGLGILGLIGRGGFPGQDRHGNREEGSHVPICNSCALSMRRASDGPPDHYVRQDTSSVGPAQVISGAERVWPQRGPPFLPPPLGRRASSLTQTSNHATRRRTLRILAGLACFVWECHLVTLVDVYFATKYSPR